MLYYKLHLIGVCVWGVNSFNPFQWSLAVEVHSLSYHMPRGIRMAQFRPSTRASLKTITVRELAAA